MILRIDHIGVAVHDPAAPSAVLESLGFVAEESGVAAAYATACRFLTHANMTVELVSPAGPDSSVTNFLRKRGEGLHHIALQVDNLQQEMARLQAAGWIFIDPEPRRGARPGMKVAFVHPASTRGILVELVQYLTDDVAQVGDGNVDG